MLRILNENTVLLEKETDHAGNAVKAIIDSGMFDQRIAKMIIDGLLYSDIAAFHGCKSWMRGYLRGLTRMFLEYANGNRQRAVDFLYECPNEFDQYFRYATEYRATLSEKERKAFDDYFNQEMSYQEMKDLNKEHRKAKRKTYQDEFAKMTFSGSSDYDLIPINSYREFNSKFGGDKTGNGTLDGSEWCHTNDEGTFKGWTDDGEKMYVLARKDWKNLEFNPETNEEMKGKDDYGNSLIAVRIDKDGEIDRVTLRCNHEGVEGSPDDQYTPPQLSRLVGFNVEERAKQLSR